MTAIDARPRQVPDLLAKCPTELFALGLPCLLAVIGALAVAHLGAYALLIPAYGLAVGLAVWSPERGALLALTMGVIFEPGAIDVSGPVADALYQMPPGFEHVLPLTMTPLEVFLCIAAASALTRRRPANLPRLPGVIFAVPLLIVLSFAYGSVRGGDIKLGYEEARGLIYGMAAFVVARHVVTTRSSGITREALIASTGLAVVVLIRYFTMTRSGLPSDLAYAHEDAVFLSAGFVLGGVLLLRGGSASSILLLLIHEALVLGALFATERRAGTLALIVGVVAVALFILRKRPKLVIGLGIPAAIMATAYLGAYWNKEYGAFAQPARAIRSQIDPSARDQSSDVYRNTERYDVETTIRLNRLMGVGLGRPFIQFNTLPSLVAFWPLQSYTPHANLLWLWLKFGAVGFAIFLSTWVMALRQCLLVIRSRVSGSQLPVAAIVCGSILLMYISYAQVDLALVGSRSAAALAATLAVALSLPLPHTSQDDADTTVPPNSPSAERVRGLRHPRLD